MVGGFITSTEPITATMATIILRTMMHEREKPAAGWLGRTLPAAGGLSVEGEDEVKPILSIVTVDAE